VDVVQFASNRITIIGDVLTSFSTAGAVPEKVWNEMIDVLSTAEYTRYFGASTGAVQMHSLHRKQVTDILRRRAVKCVLVTDDFLMRGVITATSWMGVDVRGFPWCQLPKAARSLEVSAHTAEQVWQTIEAFRKSHEGPSHLPFDRLP
jgi:hypothetical protein